MFKIQSTNQGCGAEVTGLAINEPLNADIIAELRATWLDHHVLTFPNQSLTNDSFVRFIEYFGPIGDDPYIKPIPGHSQIAAVQRRADETGQIFADTWHSDWSFLETPPAGTSLYAITTPPVGGDTLFTNEHKSLDQMPDTLRKKLEGKVAIHSARRAYSDEGIYAEDAAKGAMNIVTSKAAKETKTHPLIRPHPETGRLGIFGGSYVVGLEDTDETETDILLKELRGWQRQDDFIYRHIWQKGTLVLWDNRCVLHKATSGYEGHDRLLHRLTLSDDASYYLD